MRTEIRVVTKARGSTAVCAMLTSAIFCDDKVAAWSKEQSAGGQEPSDREAARERARIEGDKRGLALRRAEIAQEFAAAAKLATGTRLT